MGPNVGDIGVLCKASWDDDIMGIQSAVTGNESIDE